MWRCADASRPSATPFRLASVLAGFRSVFADPRAKVCFGSVFLEGIFIHGLFPYVALLLLANGETQRLDRRPGDRRLRARRGGLFAARCRCWSPASRSARLMIIGGCSRPPSLVLIALNLPWYVQIGVFAMLGFGFYLLHGSIHVHVTELSQTARGAATSLHSCIFYLGQAIGPDLLRLHLRPRRGGPEPGGGRRGDRGGRALVCARLLRHPVRRRIALTAKAHLQVGTCASR